MNKVTAKKYGDQDGEHAAEHGGRIIDYAKKRGLCSSRDTVTYPVYERAYDLAWQRAFFANFAKYSQSA